MNKDKVWSSIVLCLSVMLIFSIMAYATKGTTPTTGYYLTGPPMTGASYEIGVFTNGSYYAVNGSNWHTDIVSTNGSAVWSNTVGNVTEGTIFAKEGIYNLPNVLTIPVNTKISIHGTGSNQTILNYTGGIANAFIVVDRPLFFELRDMGFDANNKTSNVLNMTAPPSSSAGPLGGIYDCEFADSSDDYGLALHASGPAFDTGVFHVERNRIEYGLAGIYTSLHDSFFINNIVTNTGSTATSLSLDGYYGADMRVDAGTTTVSGNYFGGQSTCGIFIYGWSNTIADNIIDNHARYGIYVRAVGMNQITGNKISHSSAVAGGPYPAIYFLSTATNNSFVGNTIYQPLDEETASYAIQEVNPASGNLISGNNIFGLFNQVFSLNASTIVTYDNMINGSRMMNLVSGSNTTTTTFVFTHQLYTTPNFVFCSFNTSAITAYTWTATSTQVTVTVTGSLPASWTVYAQAYWKPN